MILKLDDKIYAMPKYTGGDFLHKIIDGCNNSMRFSTSNQSILCMLKSAQYQNEKVLTTLIDPLEQYTRALVHCVEAILPSKYDQENKKDLGRAILNSIVFSFQDLFSDGIDYSFANKTLFRPAVIDQIVWAALGVDIEFIQHEQVTYHCKQQFLSLNRSSFNTSYYTEKKFDSELAEHLFNYLQGSLYKQHADIPKFDSWIDYYNQIYSNWATLDFSKDESVNKANDLIKYLVNETDYLKHCPSDISYFLILKENFDVFSDLKIDTGTPYLCDTAFYNNINNKFEWISNK